MLGSPMESTADWPIGFELITGNSDCPLDGLVAKLASLTTEVPYVS